MTELLLGPLLRHVDATSATIWVETDGPCEVGVGDAAARTFEVAGHHYALVVLTGLEPGRSTPYEVRLDGDVVWPEPDGDLPPSRIRTLKPGDPRFRLVFGSCRKPREQDALGPDALAAYAHRMAALDEAEWPESLLLLGDQVYADETTDATQDWLATRRDTEKPPGNEVADFEEYCHLYFEAWCDPAVRWLLSTVPTSMIFDDHDVRDDWNTSQAWRAKMARTSWWPERIRGALASYWVYQHLGNLGPQELAEDDLYQRVRKSGEDNAELLREFADRADREADGAKGTRWSYRRDFGPVRLLVIDSRAGRILEGGERSMIGDEEFRWIEEQAAGEFDHLLIGTSLPWLLPTALSGAQSVNERLCARPGLVGRVSEFIRQLVDLEHWPAFRASFERLAKLIARVADDGPASVSVLSGDVHHAYVARAEFPGGTAAPVHQLTCSPVHNTVPWYMNRLFRAGWSRTLTKVSEGLARRTGVRPAPLSWHCVSGPHFGNAVMTLDVDGRTATATLLRADPADDAEPIRLV
ncbi:alkaline phosphatase D family protein [Amycolatopsis sp. DG1A-15b]|uniref:alkaline phosphatase D family protein n=1 Tax=Amycolatopsis sp. DG1A-15b TaxID=3052846 RepID=UPI00255BC2DD|nr:alkaline phosphatase D family protein [Amycolatopsis sp. DG1A-15b]WIX92667.1 alkaline phosphatase D family protein [Amycolatopsis sp. DG1A-15b]